MLLELTDECKLLASQASAMLTHIKEKSTKTIEQIAVVKKQLNDVSSLANTLAKARGNVENIGDLVESELLSMDKAIEEAAGRMQVIEAIINS